MKDDRLSRNMDPYRNTMADHIIAFLGSCRSSRIYYRILRERAFARAHPNSLRSTLHKLEKAGYVKRVGLEVSLTNKRYYNQKTRLEINILPSPFPKGSSDWAIVSFDICETKRRERNWLRSQLKAFGYRMIQRSVWIGPGPLPKSFKQVIEFLDIRSSIRIFRIK